MSKIDFIFSTKLYDNFLTSMESGEVFYRLWGELDILIDNKSFFLSFNSNNEGKMGDSSISSKGMAVPVFALLFQLADAAISLIEDEEGRITIGDPEMQIDKCIIAELHEEKVKFGICYNDFASLNPYVWYDGEKIISSNYDTPPISKSNIISREEFSLGCIDSVRRFLDYLVKNEPEVNNTDVFIQLARKVNF